VSVDPTADDFVWQKGYAWCLTTPEAASGCAVYNSQAGGELPEMAVLPPGARCCRVDEGWEKMKNYKLSGGGATRETPSKANPGHLLLCGNALLFGAAMATGDVLCGRGSEYIPYVYVYVIHIHTDIHIHVCVCVLVCVCVCVCVCVGVCVCVCMMEGSTEAISLYTNNALTKRSLCVHVCVCCHVSVPVSDCACTLLQP
jgi:hypothetical protein